MWSISFERDPLDVSLSLSGHTTASELGRGGGKEESMLDDPTKCESVIAKASTSIKKLISLSSPSSKTDEGDVATCTNLVDAFEEGGRVARTTLAHLFSHKINDSCSQIDQEESVHMRRHVIEPLHFMRRWKKIQQLRSKYTNLNGNCNTKTDSKETEVKVRKSQQRSYAPYIMERTDVWCDESSIYVTLAVILDHQSDGGKEGDLTTTSMQKHLLDYMEKIATAVMKTNDFMSHIANVVLQSKIRASLSSLDAVAFIADGSIMPRKSGASFAPMSTPPAIPFKAPGGSNLTKEVTICMGKLAKYVRNQNVSCCDNTITITGMVIPKGITLIVGGGYHGKSTMLRTIMVGIYDKILGDGRELCVTDENAITVRAEDGRYVNNTNVSAFISNLPIMGSDTKHFSTREASGSTSQAANVVDAIEMGASAILVDEDVSAANFMSRDGRMRALIMDESITPLLYRVNGLFDKHGISSVVVVGGVGDWLDVPNAVIRLEKYVASDALEKAKSISHQFSYGHVQYGGRGVVHRLKWDNEGTPFRRRPRNGNSIIDFENVRISLIDGGKLSLSRWSEESRMDDLLLTVFGTNNDFMDIDRDEDTGTMDLSRCEQLLAGKYQLYGCAICVVWLLKTATNNPTLDLNQLLDKLESALDRTDSFHGILASISSSGKVSDSLLKTLGYAIRPRRYEVIMALNRMRGIEFEELPPDDKTIAELSAKEREEEERKRILAELWANRRKK